MPASLNRPIILASGPRPKETARTCALFAIISSTISSAPGWKTMEIDAERPVCSRRTASNFSRASGGVMTAAPKTRSAGIAAADHQRGLGHPAHRGLDDRPMAAQPLDHHRVCSASAISLPQPVAYSPRHGFRVEPAETIRGVQVVLRMGEMMHMEMRIGGGALAAQILDMVERLLGQPIAKTRSRGKLGRRSS